MNTPLNNLIQKLLDAYPSGEDFCELLYELDISRVEVLEILIENGFVKIPDRFIEQEETEENEE